MIFSQTMPPQSGVFHFAPVVITGVGNEKYDYKSISNDTRREAE